MPDLFISYSSHDRPWADRLYSELKASYPTLDIFLDHISIPPGANWRQVLVDTAVITKNLIVLWSDKAQQSKEVGPEIQAFEQAKRTTPTVDGLPRTLFYLPLQGDYGPMTAIQSFVKFRDRALYDPTLRDCGVSSLDTPELRPILNESIQWIGDKLARHSPVTLAVLAMHGSIVNLLQPFVNIQTLPGYPTLGALLANLGIGFPQLSTRYGATAFEWKPFGTVQTVIDVMEEVRRDTNPKLNSEYRFQWREFDVYGEMIKANAVEPVVQTLMTGGPSILVIDPISLHNALIKPVFDKLGDYFMRQDSIVISLAPNQSPWIDSMLLSISEKGGNILNPYFNPLVPATGTFAGCGLNLTHKMEVARLVRSGLGLYHLKRKRLDEGELVKMV